MWLGSTRGELTDWSTQQWVKVTGKRIDLAENPWLSGPTGPVTGVGRTFFDDLAAASGLDVRRDPSCGLLRMETLRGPSFSPERVHPSVRSFYEHTAQYDLESWSEWCGLFRPFGWLLAVLFSRRLQQLNVPLRPLDTSGGTTSQVIQLVNPRDNAVIETAWLRELRRTGNVLYAGCYSAARVPGHPDPCVKVVFPLPNGNAIVLLKPDVDPSGALTITSSGRRFGDPGFYFTVHDQKGNVWARYLATLRESIRVYAAEDGGVRADHVLTIWRQVFLRLHYRLRIAPELPLAQTQSHSVPVS